MNRTLTDLNSTLEELSEQPMLKKLLWRDDVASRIVAAYKDLSDAVRLFDVSSSRIQFLLS